GAGQAARHAHRPVRRRPRLAPGDVRTAPRPGHSPRHPAHGIAPDRRSVRILISPRPADSASSPCQQSESRMPPPLHLDPTQIDLEHVVADQEAIRKVNPQRFEMEMLTAIVLFDPEQNLIAGYKDVRADEFWVRGHMPDYPLMPGVLMCEAAAQLCAYYVGSG